MSVTKGNLQTRIFFRAGNPFFYIAAMLLLHRDKVRGRIQLHNSRFRPCNSRLPNSRLFDVVDSAVVDYVGEKIVDLVDYPISLRSWQRPRQLRSKSLQASQPQDLVEAADDLRRYLNDSVTAQIDWKKVSLFEWWARSPYVGLRQWAYDVLSIPATAGLLEGLWSQAKRIWSTDRNSLAPEGFEAILSLVEWDQQQLYIIPH
jgi:hypothetical protein